MYLLKKPSFPASLSKGSLGDFFKMIVQTDRRTSQNPTWCHLTLECLSLYRPRPLWSFYFASVVGLFVLLFALSDFNLENASFHCQNKLFQELYFFVFGVGDWTRASHMPHKWLPLHWILGPLHLALELALSPGRPWTSSPPTSASKKLRLQVCGPRLS